MTIQGTVKFPPSPQLPILPQNATLQQIQVYLTNLQTTLKSLHTNALLALTNANNVTNQISNASLVLLIGLDANKPNTGFTGNRFYAASDTQNLYIDTGYVWMRIVGGLNP
jgi:hypothetical protein